VRKLRPSKPNSPAAWALVTLSASRLGLKHWPSPFRHSATG
jgi:hypothetical protein